MTTFDELWPTIEPLTLLHKYKALLVHEALLASPPEGDAVECGVFRGGIVVMMAKVMISQAVTPGCGFRQVVAYDSFQGLPDDRSSFETEHYRPGHMVHSETAFRNTLREHGVDGAVDVVAGWFSDTMKFAYNRPVNFVHVDCDMYNSARSCIDHLYDPLLPGGIMVFDDYFDQGGGVQAAVDELVASTKDVLHAGYGDQVFVVKDQKWSKYPTSLGPCWQGPSWRSPKPHLTIPHGSGLLEISCPANDHEYQRDLLAGKLTGELPGGTLTNARRVAERLLAQCDLHDEISTRQRTGKNR